LNNALQAYLSLPSLSSTGRITPLSDICCYPGQTGRQRSAFLLAAHFQPFMTMPVPMFNRSTNMISAKCAWLLAQNVTRLISLTGTSSSSSHRAHPDCVSRTNHHYLSPASGTEYVCSYCSI